MSIFCPFLKDQCKQNECVAWKDDQCFVVSCVQRFLIPTENKEESLVSAQPDHLKKELEDIRKTSCGLLARKRRLEIENEKVKAEAKDIESKFFEYTRKMPKCDVCKKSILKEVGNFFDELSLIAQELQETENSLADLKQREDSLRKV